MAKKRDRRARKRYMKVVNWHSRPSSYSRGLGITQHLQPISLTSFYDFDKVKEGDHIGLRMWANGPRHHLHIKGFSR